MNTKIDRERWSEESKRSYAYHYQATSYEDIHYECSKCRAPSVFTAQEQKVSFEEKKNYIWQHRTLCPKCNAELFAFGSESALARLAGPMSARS